MSRQKEHQERQNAAAIIYIHLIRNQNILEIVKDNEFISAVSDFIPSLHVGSEMLEVCIRAAKRRDIYEKAINQTLKKDWKFARLGYMEQAILLTACSELELGYQNKVFVIDEAIRLAKEYGEESSYKLINGVLDAI